MCAPLIGKQSFILPGANQVSQSGGIKPAQDKPAIVKKDPTLNLDNEVKIDYSKMNKGNGLASIELVGKKPASASPAVASTEDAANKTDFSSMEFFNKVAEASLKGAGIPIVG